ncbi:hypothetical protein SASPL_134589 [Salvia splendens]|uniref:Uncharacterized protein n=1 Tax=Salvia splendens TaxID=180675 RepID=A0A8X8WWM2_SALSN|nr:hypothetical protein SASPL_134589 [Salvia splendens]
MESATKQVKLKCFSLVWPTIETLSNLNGKSSFKDSRAMQLESKSFKSCSVILDLCRYKSLRHSNPLFVFGSLRNRAS